MNENQRMAIEHPSQLIIEGLALVLSVFCFAVGGWMWFAMLFVIIVALVRYYCRKFLNVFFKHPKKNRSK